MRRLRTSSTILSAFLLATPIGVAAQQPDLYVQAEGQLAGHDTIGALESLRELTRRTPDFAPGWGLLAEVLAGRAGSVATDFTDRLEAEKAVNRALELDSDNPLYLFTLGAIKRKQQIYLDARRLIDRAVDKLEEGGGDLDPADVAELWFQRGLFYEDEYLDTHHLVFAPMLPVAGNCPTAPTFCMNFKDPKQFNERLRTAEDLSHFGEDDYERMAEAFDRALQADLTHAGAFRRQAVHMIDRGDLRDAESLARSFIRAAAEDPWGHLTLGLVHYRMGRDSLAEAAFDRGLALARPEIAAHYRDVSPVMREEQADRYSKMNEETRRVLEEVLWRKSDPLYLTSANEVRVAHLARVAFADLMFEDPTEGVWGSETEQGVIYVRYGPPNGIFKLHRDAEKELSSLELAEAYLAAESGITDSNTQARVGGRWILWNYGWQLPNFIFQKPIRWRHTSHMTTSFSATWDEQAREMQPAVYETGFEILDYPTQFARFRGTSDEVIELDIYSEVPAARLFGGVPVDSVRAGLFLFAGPEHSRVYERKLNLAGGSVDDESGRALTYTLPLPPGRFTVALEAQARDAGAAATRREVVELHPFVGDSLSLSDLVLAYSATPKVDRPAERRDFALKVNRRIAYQRDDPFAVYWEVYGLRTDEEGLAHYRVTLSVKDAEGEGVLARVVGALGGLVGLSDEREPELTFERIVEPFGDRVPEYMSLELGLEDAGEYRLRVEVVDEVGGGTAVSERVFRYDSPEDR